MATREQAPEESHIEDPPRLSAETIGVGSALTDIFRSQPKEVRRELLSPLVSSLTSTEVRLAGLSSTEAEQLADVMEENARELRQYVEQQKRSEDMPTIPYVGPAEDY